jgi:hypothetical protein
VHRDLIAYEEILSRKTDQKISDQSKLMAPMVAALHAQLTGSSFVSLSVLAYSLLS